MRRKYDDMDEMKGVAKRLRDERPEASPLELDRIKRTAMARAKSGTRGRAGSRRLAVAGLTAGLLVATTGGVLAGEGDGGHGGNAAIAQYGSNCVIVGNSGNGGNSNGNGGNGDGNGTGNGGNFNGNGSGDFNCNEDSFNTEITNITTINTTTGGAITNNYYSTTVSATPAVGVQGAKTTKPATSGRHIKIHVKVPHGLKLRKVAISVDGKSVKTLYGKTASKNIELVDLPCSTGATTVTITVKLSDGKTVTSTHQYKLCA
jgi:hypothetical protein